MISYEKQLDLKRNVVIKAYKNYSGLPQTSVPEIQSTIGSPLQYGYRTKITPHFEISKKRKEKEHERSNSNDHQNPSILHTTTGDAPPAPAALPSGLIGVGTILTAPSPTGGYLGWSSSHSLRSLL